MAHHPLMILLSNLNFLYIDQQTPFDCKMTNYRTLPPTVVNQLIPTPRPTLNCEGRNRVLYILCRALNHVKMKGNFSGNMLERKIDNLLQPWHRVIGKY